MQKDKIQVRQQYWAPLHILLLGLVTLSLHANLAHAQPLAQGQAFPPEVMKKVDHIVLLSHDYDAEDQAFMAAANTYREKQSNYDTALKQKLLPGELESRKMAVNEAQKNMDAHSERRSQLRGEIESLQSEIDSIIPEPLDADLEPRRHPQDLDRWLSRFVNFQSDAPLPEKSLGVDRSERNQRKTPPSQFQAIPLDTSNTAEVRST